MSNVAVVAVLHIATPSLSFEGDSTFSVGLLLKGALHWAVYQLSAYLMTIVPL
jgi:hypothetical protein